MKQNIEISGELALQLYPNSPQEFKTALEKKFGVEFFLPIEERINTLEDALKVTDRPSVPEFDCVPEDLREFFKATYKCVVIAEALNGGKRFDIYNADEYRHYPYFINNGSASAFGLRAATYDLTFSYAGSGSRLAFVDSKKAKIAGEKFNNEFRDMLSL